MVQLHFALIDLQTKFLKDEDETYSGEVLLKVIKTRFFNSLEATLFLTILVDMNANTSNL